MITDSGFIPKRRNAVFKSVSEKKETPHADPFFAPAHSVFSEPESIRRLSQKCLDGRRLDYEDAKTLYAGASLETLAALAHHVRSTKHPEPVVTYVGDRNINYSNICVCGCRFCAFFRPKGHPEAYVIDRDTMRQKINETIRLGGTQILLQGGHNPDLPLEWYEDLLSWMRETWPDLHIHAFSPPEIHYWSTLFHLPVPEILKRLQKAGLNSIPGGGAEILQNEVRARVSPNKCSADEWLSVMREAHKLGMRTTATMMFGHEEEVCHRLDHLFAVRALQDETHGFTAFIPWTFQPNNTRIHCQSLPSPAYLRLLAISRLVLDNVDNIQASWVTMGPEVAQLALFYGANDYGSLMIEENVVAAAGVSYRMSRDEINAVIRRANFTPVQRTQDYRPLNGHGKTS
ncbi:MAG: dehypoxanthine futalosine cyclase [Desulfovibrio sp.]|nr:dehypoxanthine futalosine cyclase [Desulfovibrio sp.]